MAEVTQEPGHGSGAAPGAAIGARAGLAVQVTGAVMSFALLVGMGVWGYKLVVRDLNGIPVVRAMDGPMRQAPDNPGGELALHTGLAVNAVAGLGEAAPTEETLVLAPVTPDLTEEDLMVQPTAEAGEYLPGDLAPIETTRAVEPPQPIVLSRDEEVEMSTEEILALADQIAAGAEPLSALSEAPLPSGNPLSEAVAAAVAEAGSEATAEPVTTDAALSTGTLEATEGLTRALRPPARPAGLVSSSSAGARAVPQDGGGTLTVSEGEVPEGTVLVQLGAFDSVDLAGGAWVELAGRFEDFMEGRDRLIQVATSGGRDFYRLRATGFADLDDARRFCSALVAEDAACIPVVVK